MDCKTQGDYAEHAEIVVFAWEIGWWFCCLNPRERGVLRATIVGIAETLNVGIPLGLWVAYWALYPAVSAETQVAFLRIYRLEIVTIVIDPEQPPVDVVRALDPWVFESWAVFLLTAEAACLDGCEQSRLPA